MTLPGEALTATIILAVFWFFMLASLRDKSMTFDELGYAVSGYCEWHFQDYHLSPESGQLSQRMAGLGMLMAAKGAPATDSKAWHVVDFWSLGFQWFYEQGNDAGKMAAAGRGVCGLLAVGLGALVWAWSRRLFGPVGGMLSLLLFEIGRAHV